MPNPRPAARFRLLISALVLPAHIAAAQTAPAPAPATAALRLTLNDAVTRAIAQNTTVAVGKQTLARAEALLAQARAGLFPTLTGNASATFIDDERVLTSGGTSRVVAGQHQRSANLQLIVPLLNPASITATNRTRDTVEEAETALADLRRQVGLQAARAWLAVVSQQRVVEASERARDAAKAHFEYAHARLAGGIGRSLDDVRAAQELAISQAQVENAHAGLARAREALGILVAADGPVDVVDAADVAAVAGVAIAPRLDPHLADATERRLDVRAAKAKVTSAEHTRKGRWAYYAPYVAAVGEPFYRYPASIVNPELGWQVQLVLSLPLYDGGRRGAVFRHQDAELAEARAQLDGQLRQVRAEVRAAFEVLLRADRALESARQSVELARRSLDLANLAYQAGATSNIEVIDAERRARDAETSAAVAEDSARLARLDLLAASGRFPPPSLAPAAR